MGTCEMGISTGRMARSSAYTGVRQGNPVTRPGRRIPIRRPDHVARSHARPAADIARRAAAKVLLDAIASLAILLVLMFGLPWVLWAISTGLGWA